MLWKERLNDFITISTKNNVKNKSTGKTAKSADHVLTVYWLYNTNLSLAGKLYKRKPDIHLKSYLP